MTAPGSVPEALVQIAQALGQMTYPDVPGALVGIAQALADAEAYVPGGLPSASVTLSSADILDLHNTPIELVAAPGAGKYIQIHRHTFDYEYGTTDYVAGDSLYLAYGADVEGVGVDATPYINASQGVHYSAAVETNLSYSALAAIDNQPIMVSALGVAITGGDGTIPLWKAWYTIEDVPA